MVELLAYSGGNHNDHWAFFVRSHDNPDFGVMIHATGDVMNGFTLEIKRCHDFQATGNYPTKRIPLQWVDAQYFDENAMFNNGIRKVDHHPVCRFESSAFQIGPPAKCLNTAANGVST
jgi:hypothetical protein